jgi:aminocarboxymuconate-semialdehyde decarboxylase
MLNDTSDPSPSLGIVDFHSHFVGPAFTLTTLAGIPPAQRGFWEGVNRMLVEPKALLSSIAEDGVGARVISTPLEFLQDAEGNVPAAMIARVNDAVANLVSQYPGQLHGLATVNAYAGEAGARELTRAVAELGLRGVFIESAKGDLLPDAPEARPTFAAAAALGVPIFMHPIEDPSLFRRFKTYGRLGVRLTRGTINAAGLCAMMESGMFEEMPNLRIVVTALALGGLLLAGGVGDGARLRKDTPAALRRHVYIDTTGLHPVTLRCAVDLLGADHVLLGTDWPIVIETPERIRKVLATSGLNADGQRLVARDTALSLLGVEASSVAGGWSRD